jgi:imidazolonepropionase-like amidohydrolase
MKATLRAVFRQAHVALVAAALLGGVGCAANPGHSPTSGSTPPSTPRVEPREPTAQAVGAVRCGVLWDPTLGAIADGRVVFGGDHVVAVGAASSTPAPPAGEVDLRPRFCMPGLVDAHTHLMSYAHESPEDSVEHGRAEAARNALLTLQAGVTSVRDLGGDGVTDLWLRDGIAAGTTPGPRMQCAGAQIGNSGGLDGPASARAAVDANASRGVDVIKLFATGGAQEPTPLMTREELKAATEEAHARGLRVAVHAIGREGIDASIAAGVDSIEHGDELTVEGARAMAARGIVLVPTLYILRYYVEDADYLGFSAEDVAGLRRTIQSQTLPFEARMPAILATGVHVAMGSDSFMALHGRNARELAYMVRAGMTPEQALRAATATAAELLHWQGKVGTVAVGAYADLVAFDGDPRQAIEAVERPALVVQGGRIVADLRRR